MKRIRKDSLWSFRASWLILCALAVVLAGCDGCATADANKGGDFALRAYQAIGGAQVAYDVSMRICADLVDSGKITEEQWSLAASVGKKVKASIILASAAMMEYRLAKDAGVDTMDAKGKAEHALLVLAKDAALLADQIRTLSGKEAVK